MELEGDAADRSPILVKIECGYTLSLSFSLYLVYAHASAALTQRRTHIHTLTQTYTCLSLPTHQHCTHNSFIEETRKKKKLEEEQVRINEKVSTGDR